LEAHANPATVEPPQVPVTVYSVSTGGAWQTAEARGMFRVVIENLGAEHVHSRLWLEWLTDPAPERPATVTARKLVSELSKGNWSLGLASDSDLSKGLLRVGATNPYTLEEKSFSVQIGAPGSYQVVRHAV
jgi:hypothetical protein